MLAVCVTLAALGLLFGFLVFATGAAMAGVILVLSGLARWASASIASRAEDDPTGLAAKLFHSWLFGYRAMILPTGSLVALAYLVQDPSYRFPLIAFLLPVFLRAAAKTLGIATDTTDESKVGRTFVMLGFAGFAVGWLLVFALVVFTVAVGLFSASGSADVLKVAMVLAAVGFVVAAWFWWPWYARDELANWPRHDVRVWASSSNRWDRLYLSWRMQQLAAAGALRWRGFGATCALVVSVFGLAAVGAYDGLLPRGTEVLLVLLLPILHTYIVREADALCARWASGRPAK